MLTINFRTYNCPVTIKLYSIYPNNQLVHSYSDERFPLDALKRCLDLSNKFLLFHLMGSASIYAPTKKGKI